MPIILFLSLSTSNGTTASGLKVVVHAGGSGKICISSLTENLTCKNIEGPDKISFQSGLNSIKANQKFNVCLNDFCKTAVNGPEKKAVHVYFIDGDINDFKQRDSVHIHENDNYDINKLQIPIFSPYLILIGLFLIIVIIIAWNISKRKYRERRQFSRYIKREIISKQSNKCAICNQSVGLWDFDHIDGNRSNNGISNCQALCPICHAKKTRGLIKVKSRQNHTRLIMLFSITIFFLLAIFFMMTRNAKF